MAIHTRLLKTVAYEAGQTVRVAIPRNHFLTRLRLRVTKGALAGGTNGNFVPNAGNKLVKRVELSIGGQVTNVNLSYENLRRLNLLNYKDNPPSEGYAFLDLGLLPTMLFTSLDLLFTFESVQNLNDGDRTAINGASVEIFAREVLNEGQKVARLPLLVRKTLSKDLANVNGETPIDLRDGNILQALLLVPSSPTLLKSVSILQDGVKYHRAKEPYEALREENKADFELDSTPTDFAVLNFDAFGEGSQTLRTRDMETLDLVVDTNPEAGGKLELVVLEFAQLPQEA